MKTLALVMSTLVLALGGATGTAAPEDDVTKKVTETYAAAADWLVSQQDASGAWKQSAGDKAVPSPAFTGLIAAAF